MAEIRLICPGCGAEYRVPETAIPPDGREVECSACGKIWHAEAQALRLGPPVAPGGAGTETSAEGPRLSRKLPDSVLDILRDEVEHERRARAADAAPADAPAAPPRPRALPEIDWPATTITRPAPPPQNVTPLRDPAKDPAPAAADTAPPAADPVPLPLIRLVPVLSDGPAQPRPTAPRIAPAPRPARRGYGAGFALALLVLAALLALYLLAPAGADLAGGGLEQFRAQVDAARLWLQDRAAGLTR